MPFGRDHVGGEPGNIFGLKDDLARIRGVDAGDDVDECRFSGPVRADKGVDAPFLQLESDPGKGLNAAEALADVVDFKENMMVW